MSKRKNTRPAPAPQPLPQYEWPRPGDDLPRLPWSDFLRLWARVIDQDLGGPPGHFLGNWIAALAIQAEALGAHDPTSHFALAQTEAEREAAWQAALEAEAAQLGSWELTGDPDDPEATGSLDGHPGQEEGARQCWIGPPDDITYRN
jgi:hypothetical protein